MADSDIPPLDDMTELLQQAKKLRDLKLSKNGSEGDTDTLRTTKFETKCQGSSHLQNSSQTSKSRESSAPAKSPTKQPQSVTATTTSTNTSENTTQQHKTDFGGLKKGFLFGGPKTCKEAKPVTQNTTTNSSTPISNGASMEQPMPFIKPKPEDKDSKLKLTEVQEAMESASGLLKDKEWVTDDFLQKVQNNEVILRRLNDPQFMQAITEFQTNPQMAMAKYQGNQEVQLFLKEFCGLLGEHFSNLGDQEDKTKKTSLPLQQTGPKIMEIPQGGNRTSPITEPQRPQVPVDSHVQQILSDPANQEILMDPNIQMLIQNLRNNPEKAQKMLRESDDSFRQKIDRLISLGLLKFQS